jgi:hypothetical protein
MKIDPQIQSATSLLPKSVTVPTKATAASPSSTPASAVDDTVSLQSPAQRSQHILHYALSQSLTLNHSTYGGQTRNETSTSSDAQASTENSNSLFDYQAVADNVLSFVSRALKARQQAGDSAESLQSLMAQARSGIDQGFSAAGQELKQQGMLSDEIQKGMDKSYASIGDGLTSLDDQIASGEPISVITPAQKLLAQQQASSQSAALTLTTKEGDRITIQFSQQQSAGVASLPRGVQSYARMQQQNAASATQSAVWKSSQNYSYTVEGNLSDAEKASLGDVFKQIGSLSDQFFNGHIEDAVKQAQDLNLSDTEWSSLSLQLTQQQSSAQTTSSTQADSATTDTSGLSDNQKAALKLPDTFSQLGKYLDQLQSLLKTVMGQLDPDSQQTLQQWVVTQQTPDKSPDQTTAFASFNQRLTETLQQLQENQG